MIYVISDLHGYPFDKFQELLTKASLSKNDYLFILGDVIDRGMDGIQYLKWLMVQPNVELILGNHEAMMLSCDFLFDEINEQNISTLTVQKMSLLDTWKDNGAKWTIERLYYLHSSERKHIINYLRDAPLYETVSVNNQDFLLTHSGLQNFDIKKKLSEYTADDFLWNRPKLSDRYYDDIKTVFGHSPTFMYGKEHSGKIIKTDTWINIDVGTGYGYSPVLLRLDDMKEFSL